MTGFSITIAVLPAISLSPCSDFHPLLAHFHGLPSSYTAIWGHFTSFWYSNLRPQLKGWFRDSYLQKFAFSIFGSIFSVKLIDQAKKQRSFKYQPYFFLQREKIGLQVFLTRNRFLTLKLKQMKTMPKIYKLLTLLLSEQCL